MDELECMDGWVDGWVDELSGWMTATTTFLFFSQPDRPHVSMLSSLNIEWPQWLQWHQGVASESSVRILSVDESAKLDFVCNWPLAANTYIPDQEQNALDEVAPTVHGPIVPRLHYLHVLNARPQAETPHARALNARPQAETPQAETSSGRLSQPKTRLHRPSLLKTSAIKLEWKRL